MILSYLMFLGQLFIKSANIDNLLNTNTIDENNLFLILPLCITDD